MRTSNWNISLGRDENKKYLKPPPTNVDYIVPRNTNYFPMFCWINNLEVKVPQKKKYFEKNFDSIRSFWNSPNCKWTPPPASTQSVGSSPVSKKIRKQKQRHDIWPLCSFWPWIRATIWRTLKSPISFRYPASYRYLIWGKEAATATLPLNRIATATGTGQSSQLHLS